MPRVDKSSIPNLPEAQFFSVNEAAVVLGVSRKFIQTWITDGLLPAFQLGQGEHVVRIRRFDLDVFIQQHGDLLEAARK